MAGEEPAGGTLALERLVFFSDAVFAIAITLLVLEIHVPRLESGAPSAAFAAELGQLVPNMLGFALSFMVIGLFWLGHHRLFVGTHVFASALMWPNLFFLMAIAFMPFATAFMSANGNAFVPALVYNLTLLASALGIWWLSHRLARASNAARALFEHDRSTLTVVAAALCVALAFVIPQWSQIGMVLTIAGPRWARWREKTR
jgi:uncharacterized membrane protein